MTAIGQKKSTSTKEDFIKSIDDLFLKIELAYHYQFYKVFGTDEKLKEGKTVVNFSTESPLAAAASIHNGVPSVVVVRDNYWQGSKTQSAPFDITIVRCPAEYNDKIGCNNCGNGSPLCARLKRNFIVGFTAHGASKRLAADNTKRGGCYADAGNCRIWWQETAESEQPDETDGEKLLRFAASLPPRAIIRHHVAGDIGAE